jgi:hypothetical protein
LPRAPRGVAGYNKRAADGRLLVRRQRCKHCWFVSVHPVCRMKNAESRYELTTKRRYFKPQHTDRTMRRYGAQTSSAICIRGIRGRAEGAIYNSFGANRRICVKYYNAIADAWVQQVEHIFGRHAQRRTLIPTNLQHLNPIHTTDQRNNFLAPPTPIPCTSTLLRLAGNNGILDDET